jgi:hypothetical protein
LLRGELALETGGDFAGRHGDFRQSKGLGHDGIGAVALALEVRPVTGGACVNAAVLHFKAGKFGLQHLNLGVQGVDVRPVTTR